MVDSSQTAADNARLLSQQALGAGRPNNEDPAGGENALMELITGALNRFAGVTKFIPGANFVGSVGTAPMQAGLESPEGYYTKQIRPSQNITGGDGFFFKIFLALKKGGMGIQDLTKGIEPQQAVDMSWARLGELPTPSGLPASGAGVGAGMEV